MSTYTTAINFCKKYPEKVEEWFYFRSPHWLEMRERNKKIFKGVLKGQTQRYYAKKFNLPKARIQQIMAQYSIKIYYHYAQVS